MVIVEGRLQERRWETENGQQKSRHEVVAQSVRFFPKKDTEAVPEVEDIAAPEDTTEIEPF